MTRTKRRDNENEHDKKDLLLIQGYGRGAKIWSRLMSKEKKIS